MLCDKLQLWTCPTARLSTQVMAVFTGNQSWFQHILFPLWLKQTMTLSDSTPEMTQCLHFLSINASFFMIIFSENNSCGISSGKKIWPIIFSCLSQTNKSFTVLYIVERHWPVLFRCMAVENRGGSMLTQLMRVIYWWTNIRNHSEGYNRQQGKSAIPIRFGFCSWAATLWLWWASLCTEMDLVSGGHRTGTANVVPVSSAFNWDDFATPQLSHARETGV